MSVTDCLPISPSMYRATSDMVANMVVSPSLLLVVMVQRLIKWIRNEQHIVPPHVFRWNHKTVHLPFCNITPGILPGVLLANEIAEFSDSSAHCTAVAGSKPFVAPTAHRSLINQYLPSGRISIHGGQNSVSL